MDERKTVANLADRIHMDVSWVRAALADLGVDVSKRPGSEDTYHSYDPVLEARVLVLCADMEKTFPDFPQPTLHKSWMDIAQEQRAWSQYNFKDSPPHQPLLGIVEEWGELQAAAVVDDTKEVEDAAGDICIYTLDYVMRIGVVSPSNMSGFFRQRGRDVVLMDPMQVVGKLAHTHLKTEQNIRGRTFADTVPVLRDMIATLQMVSGLDDENLLDITHETWSRVAFRDWIRYPKSGRPQVEV